MSNMVKVAILDTGCNASHNEIEKCLKQGAIIGGYKDFIDDKQKEMIDNCGHGTHMTHILIRTAPYVKIYIARVFDQSAGDEVTPKRVADAIQYAVSKPWDVDIISMSFTLNGTREDQLFVKEAIEAARRQKPSVLMFAAASNNRENDKHNIGFPASLGTSVICINSHQGSTEERSTFSPVAKSGRANFALLGEGILAAWGGEDSELQVRKKGTSCATPVAAATAAIILDYSRQLKKTSMAPVWHRFGGKTADSGVGGQDNEAPQVSALQDLQTIKHVFFRLMVAREDENLKVDDMGRYNIVRPWFLFDFDKHDEKWISNQLCELTQKCDSLTLLH